MGGFQDEGEIFPPLTSDVLLLHGAQGGQTESSLTTLFSNLGHMPCPPWAIWTLRDEKPNTKVQCQSYCSHLKENRIRTQLLTSLKFLMLASICYHHAKIHGGVTQYLNKPVLIPGRLLFGLGNDQALPNINITSCDSKMA